MYSWAVCKEKAIGLCTVNKMKNNCFSFLFCVNSLVKMFPRVFISNVTNENCTLDHSCCYLKRDFLSRFL